MKADLGGIEGVESRAISVSDRSTFKDLEQKRPRVGTSPALRFANRKTGSGAFRDLAIEAYPALADPAYMRLFIALLDPLHRSEDGSEIVLTGQTLAACMAREIDYATCRLRRTYDEGGNITADETTAAFLEAFDRDVFDGRLPWTDFTAPVNGQAGKARAVPVDGLRNVGDAAVWCAWQTDRAIDPNDMKDRMYLDNGTPFGSRGRSRERQRVLAILEHVKRSASCELSARLVALLNAQPAYYFEGLRERLSAAREAVERLDTTERGKAHQRGVLENVDDQPQPYYGASDHSVRVFNIVPHLPSLSAPVRRTLLADSVEYDLAASQLAIVARDWGLPTLYDFLDAGNSPWALILDTMGLPYTPAAKKAVKRGTYGLVYGAGQSRILTDVQAEYAKVTGRAMDVRAAERFFENELIREAYAGRERELAVIRERGYAVDVFGRKITTGANGYGPADDLDYSRSILAQLNQARELWLLEPVIGLAEEAQAKARPAFRLVLWQHDGFSVKYRSDAERERREPRILAGVAERRAARLPDAAGDCRLNRRCHPRSIFYCAHLQLPEPKATMDLGVILGVVLGAAFSWLISWWWFNRSKSDVHHQVIGLDYFVYDEFNTASSDSLQIITRGGKTYDWLCHLRFSVGNKSDLPIVSDDLIGDLAITFEAEGVEVVELISQRSRFEEEISVNVRDNNTLGIHFDTLSPRNATIVDLFVYHPERRLPDMALTGHLRGLPRHQSILVNRRRRDSLWGTERGKRNPATIPIILVAGTILFFLISYLLDQISWVNSSYGGYVVTIGIFIMISYVALQVFGQGPSNLEEAYGIGYGDFTIGELSEHHKRAIAHGWR